jgi:hypothetical protein
MPATDTASRLTPYFEQLLEDESARENLRHGVDKLQDAYRRSQKRRVHVSRDEKLRKQVSSAAQLIGGGVAALKTGAEKPKRRRGKMLFKAATVAAIGAGAALALNEDLRSSVFGSNAAYEPGDDGSPA